MLLELIRAWPIVREGSIMIGDRDSDAEAGRAAGIASAIIPPGKLESFVEQLVKRARRVGKGGKAPCQTLQSLGRLCPPYGPSTIFFVQQHQEAGQAARGDRQPRR
jgi:hypothetical protein